MAAPNDSGEMDFLPEDSAPPEASAGIGVPERTVWRVLAVDDDAGFRQSTAFALSGLEVQGRPLELLQATSYTEACAILGREHDIAVILLDVMMETDDAGLRLARAVREVLGNAEVRIVLVTGQPGLAPMQSVMRDYDINDYWTKTELSVARLHSLLTANVRAYQQLVTIARARRGLQLIVESSNLLSTSRTLQEFSTRTLDEIATLLEVDPDGLICVRQAHAPQSEVRIIGAAGRFARLADHPLSDLPAPEICAALQQAISERRTLVLERATVPYFPASDDDTGAFAAWVATGRPLEPTEIELLHVFASNIGAGLHNVALFSRLDRVAYHDELVDLPNRHAMVRAIDLALERQPRLLSSLLLVDLDNFAGTNLALGPEFGNRLLRAVAQRLRQALMPTVQIARLENDVFALLGPREQIDADRVRGLLDTADDSLPGITAGIAELDLRDWRQGGLEALTAAHMTLKLAKAQGYGGLARYDARDEDAAVERFQLANELRSALAEELIYIELQPQLELRDSGAPGFEALARWRREDGSMVSPASFIPIAEATGAIVALGQRVFQLACEAILKLAASGFPQARIAVNVSALQLAREDFVVQLLNTLGTYNLEPWQFELEVTESLAMHSFEHAGGKLARLREAGFTIAIDDFGTGFSSLAYLRRLPVDVLKIDRAFVSEIGEVADAHAIADVVLRLGQRFGLRIVAEGVESRAQADWLSARGCDLGQGFGLARPMPLAQLIDWLRARTAGDATPRR